MLSENHVQELVAYQPHTPVLSVFLNTDTRAATADANKLRLRRLLAPFEEVAAADVDALLMHLEHAYDWAGMSIAMYSCQEEHFFRAYALHVPIRERARRLPRPYVKPLVDMLDQYGHYGIALVDRQKARLLLYHLGAILKEEEVTGEAVKRMKTGGGSQASGRMRGDVGYSEHHKTISGRNIKMIAQTTAEFFAENNVRRVLVGGTDETIARFRSELPKRWQALVAGTFPIEINADHADIRLRAQEAGRKALAEQERQLVNNMVTGAAKGQDGVIRLDDTLGAVRNGSIQTLIIKEGYRAPGYRCTGCEYLTSQTLTTCPFCGSRVEQIEDAVEMAVRQVLANGGDVVVIHDNEALEEAGHIGAILRY